MYKRGDVFWADLSPVIVLEQDGVRPVVILQNDIGNRYSPTVIGSAADKQFASGQASLLLMCMFKCRACRNIRLCCWNR